MQLIDQRRAQEIAAARVDTLLSELEYEGTHFVVAVNYSVVQRARWSDTELKDGDEVEILTPRQGDDAMLTPLQQNLHLAPADRHGPVSIARHHAAGDPRVRRADRHRGAAPRDPPAESPATISGR